MSDDARVCAACATQLPPSFLACPACGQLVHADQLKRLAAEAEAASLAGDAPRAVGLWRSALELLPPGTRQHQGITQNIGALAAEPGPAKPTATGTGKGQGAKWAAGLGTFGLLLAKFKWAILFVLAKGKILLIGLTQAKTLLSMLFALGVYTSVHGWKFAIGLIVSIYVHEMGHVAWLRHYGIPATAPMFVPGLGAFVRLKSHPATPLQDARVGLAGPLWGTAAALIFLAGGLAMGHPSWKATAHVGAWINLFNLLPVWQLDGGRAFVALSRRQRGFIAGLLWLLVLTIGDGMLVLLAVAASARAAMGPAPERGERSVVVHYAALAIVLALLLRIG